MTTASGHPPIDRVECRLYVVPTDQPEADGTLAWSSTTVVFVTLGAGDVAGTGWTYAGPACRPLVEEPLRHVLVGNDPMDVPRSHEDMVRACRNLGRPGVVATAISALDVAAWDLKSKLLDLPLSTLFGRYRHDVPLYGSGGFTTYDDATAAAQVEGWLDLGLSRMKMKVGESWGTETARDLARVELMRRVAGDAAELFVDANGGYRRKLAIRMGQQFFERWGVTWFEEPVSSDDLVGLRLVRDQLPVDVAAGEYGYDEMYFSAMVDAGAVDCLQVDVTRCGGYTSWLHVAAMAGAHGLDVSAHCSPALHAPVAMAVPNLRHVEYFHDHQRLETMLFDGVPAVSGGAAHPDGQRPGHGYVLREVDAEPFRIA